jgi:tetratricopeptide (TPR) repeat protein
LYAKLTGVSPEWEDAWFRLGYLRFQRADYRGAIEAFEECIARRGKWSEAMLNLALSHWKLGAKDNAKQVFENLLAVEPESVDALRGLSALAVERHEYQQALEFQSRLIDLGERSPELFYNTGLLLQRSGHVEDAIRLYREALAERPNFAEALLNLGHALKAHGQTDEARQYWRQALDAKPELAHGYFEG